MNLLRGQRVRLAELCGKENPHEFFIHTSMLSQNDVTYDIGCFGVDEFGKCSDERFFIFFNQKKSPGGGIELLDVTSDDESSIRININNLPRTIKKLVFTATVDADESLSALKRGELAIIFESRIVGRFSFNGTNFSEEKSIIIGEVYLKDDWRFSAVGQGFNGGLSALLEYFGIEEDKGESQPLADTPVVIAEKKWGVPNFIKNLVVI